mgnify:CR=1 FL=1
MKADKLDPREARALRRELDIAAVPLVIDNKLRQVYAELPEELPKARLWLRPLQRAVGVFAALAIVCGGLLGLNAANPAFAESIPGLGSLFALMNDHTMHPMGSNVGTYEGSVETLDLAATASVETDYGLIVDEAFCDGSYVYLTLRVSGPEEAEKYEDLSLACDGQSDFRLLVDGTEAELFTTGGQAMEDGTEAIALVYQLAAPVENGQEVSARLEVGSLYGVYPEDSKSAGWQYDTLEVGFTADFTLTADTSQNQSQELSAEDNGVKLYGVKTTPGYLLVDMEIPFWGRTGDLTASGGGILGYAELFTQDGQELNHNSLLNNYDFVNETDAGSVRGTWAFDGPPEQTDTVILRITDRSPDSAYAADMDRERVVFAEFAINWKTGEARPSDTYLDEGLDKVDTEKFKASWGAADFTGGFLVSNIGHTFDSWHGDINTTWVCTVNLTSEVEYQPIELRYYAGDRLLGTVQAAPKSEFNETAVNPMLGDENFFYRGEDGFYGSIEKDGGGYNLFFALYYPEDCIGATQFRERDLKDGCMVDRIEVVNTETGEVLMDDLEVGQAYTPEQ